MPKARVRAMPTTAQQRRLAFEIWQQTGNVADACRTAGIARRTFYYWKPRFDVGGAAALDLPDSSAPKRPHQIADVVVDRVIALRRAHPSWSKRRIAHELARGNAGVPPVSATTVERLLVGAGLWTVRPRAARPAARVARSVVASDAATSDDRTQTLSLPAVKFVPPRIPTALVVRTRLLEQLSSIGQQRLTLVSAAAGWGKTTLLSTWAGRQIAPIAWLSLDALDNDVFRFWIAVIAALRRCVPTLGADALAMLQSPEPAPMQAVLTTLLNELAVPDEPTPIVLILDDYQVIDRPAIHEGVAWFVERLPARLHVVLASRVDPDLPVARWRVRGEVLELRAADLRFTSAEASSLFTQVLGDELADVDVLRLEQRTEGWVAGLQLAALALRERADRTTFVQAFTGSHRYLMDYVQEEILQRQPLHVQRFLLQTAVLRRLNAEVCAALTDEPRSQAMLQWLERSNLFVMPLDDQRQCFRVHDLFRDVLLARLKVMEPELVPHLHGRAARWYAAHGTMREAIEHALAARDFTLAADLITRAAPQLWLQGEAYTVYSWIAAFPEAALLPHARLALDAALRLVESVYLTMGAAYIHARAELEQTLARMDALLGPEAFDALSVTDPAREVLPAGEVALLRRRIRLLRVMMASRALLARSDIEGLRVLAREAEELAAQDQLTWKLVALALSYWLVESLERDGALLVPRLQHAKQQAVQAGDQLVRSRVSRWLVFLYGRAGRLQLVYQEALEALAGAGQPGQFSATNGYVRYMLAGCFYAWNRLSEAERELQQVVPNARAWQQPSLLVVGYVQLVDVALARGDLAGAQTWLQYAAELVQHERFVTQTHTPWVDAARVRCWLATGDLQAARGWAQQVVFTTERWDPNRKVEVLMLVRVQLALHQHSDALATLERFRSQLDRPGDGATAIAYMALHAAALYACGRQERARVVAARLLALTAPDGDMRLFLDLGTAMHRLLQWLHSAPRDEQTTLPPASMTFVAQVLAAFAPALQHHDPAELQAASNSRAPLVEPLTPREQEVLGLLVAGAANREIAATLVVSLATVKKHVSNVLTKLGVASRAQAVARAREWRDIV